MTSKLVLPGASGDYWDTPNSKAFTVGAGTVARSGNFVGWNLAPGLNHGIRVGDTVVVDLTDNTYDGTFTVAAVIVGGGTIPGGDAILWLQAAADDADGGTGTITLTTGFRVVGPLEVWCEIAAATYIVGSAQTLAARWTTDGNNSIMFQLNASGFPRVIWTPTGLVANQIIAGSANALTTPDTFQIALRFRFWPVFGTGWRIEFGVFDAIDGILLEDLGPATGGATTSVFVGTSPLEIGGRTSGTIERFTGDFYRLLWRDDGVMLTAPDFTLQTPGATSFADVMGRTYTKHGNAVLVDDPAPTPEPEPPAEPAPPDFIRLELSGTVLELSETEGLVNTQLDLGWPTLRPVAADRPQVDGTVDTTERFGARAVSLVVAALDTFGPDGTIARTWTQNLGRLSRLLGADKRPTLHLRLDGVEYFLGLAPDQTGAPFTSPNHAIAQLSFRAPDPYLRGIGKTVNGYPFRAGTGGRTYPLTFPRTYPIPDTVSGDFQVRNDGAVDAWPVVNVWGPLATSFTLENVTTGEIFSLASTTVDAGHRLEVDMANRTVRYDGDPELPRFSLINFATSRWVRLKPGVNLFRFLTGATSDASMSVEWADPYLLPGG